MDLRIVSFDIGTINFAQSIEVCDSKKLEELSEEYYNLSKRLQRRVRGVMTPEIKSIYERMFKTSKIIDCGVYNFKSKIEESDSDDTKSKSLSLSIRRELFKHCESFKKEFAKCDIAVIEQQFFSSAPFNRFRRGGGANINAIKLAECLTSWLMINLPNIEIFHFPSPFKTQMLGAPDKMKKPDRKKWAVQKAMEICNIRGDKITLQKLQPPEKRKRGVRRQKMDDISDTIIQCQAYKFKYWIGRF